MAETESHSPRPSKCTTQKGSQNFECSGGFGRPGSEVILRTPSEGRQGELPERPKYDRKTDNLPREAAEPSIRRNQTDHIRDVK